MLENLARIEFLKKSHLFIGLSDAELALVAAELQEMSFVEAGLVFIQGSIADSLVMVYQGKVETTRSQAGKNLKVASLARGDYFGEQGLLRGRQRETTATAASGTLVLILSRKSFVRLFKKIPGLRRNFEVMVSSRQLAREMTLDWLVDNEVVHFLARKHPFRLVLLFILPVLMLLPILGILVLAYILTSSSIGLVAGFLLVSDLAWIVWRFLDWGNDYYIVTNQRVIWLEKVIAFYDSRTEAGMATILSVNTETSFFGRLFDYGTVLVRTYTGQIRMNYVPHPNQAAALIEEHLNRARENGRRTDEESMKAAIRARLGMSKPAPATLPTPVAAPSPAGSGRRTSKPFILSAWWQNAFRMRTDDGNIITYHKHIFGLLRDTAPYMLAIMALAVFMIIFPYFTSSMVPGWLTTFISFSAFILFLRIIYEYLDWKNDIYQVTPEQIIDLNRKPFGTEDRRVAALENILSTEYKRNGIIGLILNFGTVYIMVGTEAYDFEDVADPPSVQQDIIRRQQGCLQKKNETAIAAERERMTDWLAMYHHTMDDIKNEKDGSDPSNPE